MKAASIEFQGDVMRLTTKRETEIEPSEYRRGKVSVFSRKSRRRLLEKLSRTATTKRPRIFLTLTYPSNMIDPKIGKQHLRAFLERVRRAYPKASAFWRLEFQARGAVHFHLLFFNLPYWNASNIRVAWGECIGEENPRIKIEVCRSRRKSTYYVSKYMAKPSNDGSVSLSIVPYLHVGRHWGVFNTGRIPMAVLHFIEVFRNPKAFWDLRRAIDRFYPKRKHSYASGAMLFCKNIDTWYRYWSILELS